MFKKICGLIFDRILPWILVVGGTFGLIYGMWFQTEGFTIYSNYGVCPLDTCLLVLGVCTIVGLFMMSYFRNQTKRTENGGKKLGIRDMKNMIRGYVFCGYLCWVILWIAFSVTFFYVGIGGLALSISTVCYYEIWLLVAEAGERKEAKAGNKAEPAGKRAGRNA